MKVAEAGEYGLSASYATSSENAGFKLYLDDKAVTDDVIFPQGSDWETYSTFDAGKVNLTAGEHVLRLEIVGNYVNIDWLDFCAAAQCGTADTSSTVDTTTSVAARIMRLGSSGVSSYSVFDMQGKFIARFMGEGSENLQAKTASLVKRPGSYLVKSQEGGRIFRVIVK